MDKFTGVSVFCRYSVYCIYERSNFNKMSTWVHIFIVRIILHDKFENVIYTREKFINAKMYLKMLL